MGRVLDDIDVASYLDLEGLDYRTTSGSSGDQLNVRECPVCHNENYKVYLNAENGFGNCFVCSATFNRYTFIKAHLATEDRSAIRRHIADVAKALGFRPVVKKIAVYTELPEAVLPTSFALPDVRGSNHPYLDARGISADWSAQFQLRFCMFGFHTYMREGKETRQNFDDRIIIPVFNLDGELVTFQGRDITGQAEKKYLFPAQLPATGRYLYNGHEALARRAKHVIMNEGAFDVIPVAIACDLFPELSGVVPIGSFGKHLTPSAGGDKDSQVDALRRLKRQGGLETVTIMWDGEKAALDAALNASELINKIGVSPRIALLPPGKDPNEIDASEIRDAYVNAVLWTRNLSIRWRVNSPYLS